MRRNTFNMAGFLADCRERSDDPLTIEVTAFEVADLLGSLMETLDFIGADIAAAHVSQAIEALREPFHTAN